MGRFTIMAVLCCASVLGVTDAVAQQKCDNRDTINCVWDPMSNQWIMRGSAPSRQDPPSQVAPERGGISKANQESLARAREREKRENAEKIAAARPFAEQFQPVFDQVRVGEYKPYISRFATDLSKPSQWIMGSNVSGNEMEEAWKRDPTFWGPLFLRMAVARIELTEAEQPSNWMLDAELYLSIAGHLGYQDEADQVFSQIALRRLDSFVSDKVSFEKGVARWRDAVALGKQSALKAPAPINLTERHNAHVVQLETARQQAQAQIAAAARADDALRRQRMSAEAATTKRLLAAVDARWRAAGIDFPLLARLSRQQEAALVEEAQTAATQYEAGVIRRGSRPEQLRGLEAIKAAFDPASCSTSVATNCMPVLLASEQAASAYRDDYLNTIQHNLGMVECHARRVPLACRYAGSSRDAKIGEQQAQARRLAYLTLSCALPGEVKGFMSRCDFIAEEVKSGTFGPPDTAILSDLYRLTCANVENEAACAIVAAEAKSHARTGANPSAANNKAATGTGRIK